MLIEADDIEGFKPGTQITFSEAPFDGLTFERVEDFATIEDFWLELGTGKLWHSSVLMWYIKAREGNYTTATVKPKRK